MTRYQHLATLLAERIEQGLYRHGEKLPSVRSLSQEHGVSIDQRNPHRYPMALHTSAVLRCPFLRSFPM